MADNFVSSLQTFSLINDRDLDLITGPSLFRFKCGEKLLSTNVTRDKNRFFYEELLYLGGNCHEGLCSYGILSER